MAGRDFTARIVTVLGVLVACTAAQQARFFITAPNMFRVGVEETVFLSLLQPDNAAVDVELYLRLPGSPNKMVTKNVRVVEGFPVKTTLSLAADVAGLPQTGESLDLGARSLDANHPFEKVEQVLVTHQSGYVFVQTDKPIYNPNQKVQIRVMSLDQSMLPSDRQVYVEIVNPKGISVKRLQSTQAEANGFLSGTYQFPAHPDFGIWSVSAKYGPEFKVNSTVTFEVKEYVLPTFSVQLTPPKYILSGETHTSVHVKSFYVFGKPVIGRCRLKFGALLDDGEVVFSSQEKELNLNSTGEATFNLTNLANVFGRQNWFDLYEGHRFHVEAIVFETSTGFTEAAITKSTIFTRSPYKFGNSRTARYFKPSLTFQVKLDLTFANGDPAPGVPVQVTATAQLSSGGSQQLQSANVNNQVQQSPNTDDNGRINVLLSVPAEATTIRIIGDTQDPKFPANQANLNFEIGDSESPAGAGDIVIIPRGEADSRFVVGQQMSFLIQRAGLAGSIDIHYMFVTAGKVVSDGVLPNEGNNPVLAVVASQDMVPTTRVIIYYITPGGDVVADSLSVDVEEVCKGEVSLNVLPERRPPLPTHYPPNQQVQVEVTAPPLSHVGILGIDKAVYLLRKKDLLTRRKMFDRMKGYDMSCGPGGGQNAEQIFEDTGLTVLTNTNLDVGTREGIGCERNARRRRSVDQDALTGCLVNHETCLADKPNLRRRLTGGNWPCRRRALILKQECSLTTADSQVYETCCLSATTSTDRTLLVAKSVDGELEIGDTPVRDDFRETWFFDMVVIPDSANQLETFVYDVSTPGSITEWQMTAVSVSPTLGMCVADTTSITVFQNFFIQLHLPYSVVRLEQTQVVVTIFNYGLDAMEATVIFNAPEELCISASATNRRVYVTPQNASSTTFVVRPVKVGDFEITVLAGPGRTALDVVKKKLKVVPQGVTKRVPRSLTLNPAQVMFEEQRALTTAAPVQIPGVIGGVTIIQEGSQIERFNVSLPLESIPDTESCSVTLIGTLMGTIAADPIGGLDNLVRRPSGCGEQTMKYLAPTLFVYKYLQVTGSDTPVLEEKVYDFLAQGVARELSYRHDSGAYAAWKSRPGSTWLTAFVVKVFSQTNQFTPVESGHVAGSMNWIIDNNQLASGAFEENQHVIHQEMIGAVKGEVSMTAYVLISLLEARNLLVPANQKIDDAIREAREYLEGYYDGSRQEQIVKVYEKAIVAYALALAESGRAADANAKLRESKNRGIDGAVHFDPVQQNYEGSRPYWLTRRPSAISVEASAYALLAQIKRGDYDYAGRIALWLSNQQNYDGGFVSTQDTIVALQALAKYAERPLFNNIELDCTVTSDKNQEHLLNYRIDNGNAKVQKEVDVTPAIGLPITLRSTGSGIAKANVEMRYNTEEDDPDTCPFIINITANEVEEEEKLVRVQIKVCARYDRTDQTTHMSIIDVGLYSGFNAVKKDLEKVTNTSDLVASYELSDRSVIFYLDKIPNDEDVCIEFNAIPGSVVGNIQPVPLHVYDYYDPDETCTVFYKPGKGSPLLNTLCSENECICSLDSCGLCGQDTSAAELETAACTSQEAYALKIRVDDIKDKGGFKIMNITVMVPIKTGLDNVAGLEKRQLYLDAACSCPRFRKGQLYLLVGDTGLKFTMANGQEGFKYVIAESTNVEYWPGSRKKKNAARLDKLTTFQRDMTIDGCPS